VAGVYRGGAMSGGGAGGEERAGPPRAAKWFLTSRASRKRFNASYEC